MSSLLGQAIIAPNGNSQSVCVSRVHIRRPHTVPNEGTQRERSRELEGQHTLDRLIYFQCSSGKMKAKKLRMTTGGNRREMEEEEEMSVTLPSVMQRVRGDNCLRSENVRVH